MKINWKARLQSKAFWVAIISAIILLIQQLGLGQYLPENIMDIVNTILLIGSIMGIIIDPTTQGLSDSNMILNGDNSQDLQIENFKLKEELLQIQQELNNENNE